MNRLASVLAALLLSLPSWVAADAIGIPPTCSEGSTPFACHGPSTCEILGCSGDADCAGTLVCRPRALCVREHCCSGFGCTIDASGMDGGFVPDRRTHVEGPCDSGGSCTGFGLSCETRRVCVAPDGVDAGPASDAGGGTDSGTVGDDSGAPTEDGGATGSDGGTTGMDAGGAVDAGGTGTDAGGGIDAGGGGTTDGGCCSVVGERSGTGATLYLALFGLLLARRLRRLR